METSARRERVKTLAKVSITALWEKLFSKPLGGDVWGDESLQVMLLATDVMTIEWASCTPGTVATATIFYDDGRPA